MELSISQMMAMQRELYYQDVLLCFHVAPEEISRAYAEKHAKNMGRDYAKEYKELITHGQE